MRKRVTIVIDDELWKRFKISAIKENKTYSDLVEELVRDWVKKR